MKTICRAARLSLVLLVICGLVYPLFVTGAGELFFSHKANGSMVKIDGVEVGSGLIGQSFSDPKYFHGRISSVNYNTYKSGSDPKTVSSGSSNLAPSNPALKERVNKDMDEFSKSNPGVSKNEIPADLMTSSGSGLDPDISPEAAKIQIPRISKSSGIGEDELESMVEKYTKGRQLFIFGEPRVNVLELNMEIQKKISDKR